MKQAEHTELKATAPLVPDQERLGEIARMLPSGRFAMGPPIEDRAAWAIAAAGTVGATLVADAVAKLSQPVPVMTREIYGSFKATGERTQLYSDVRYNRHERIALYTLAECVENKGRFIAALEAIIADVCTEPTWIFNFHDSDLGSWNGTAMWVDLGSILPASDMAQALALLGERLNDATRERITVNCRRRILEPYRVMIEQQPDAWAYSEMNWNAVCHAGVVTTALGILEDPNEQAYFVAMAEALSANYLRGFGGDGYCSEGMTYWNYGFGNFVQMSELISRATQRRVDLLALPGAKEAALYPVRIEIINGLAPSYSDCPLCPKPDGNTFNYLNSHLNLGLRTRPCEPPLMRLLPRLMFLFPSNAEPAVSMGSIDRQGLRSFFQHGGVLTCRPRPASSGRMGVSLKGGHNEEEHNHNDLGTFVIAVGNSLPILDPGAEVYKARTFSKDRYQSKLLSSYGHPVPVVCGQLQRQGPNARAEIIRAEFSAEGDVFAMDLTSAYEVNGLKGLTRTFSYDRGGACSLIVEDSFELDSPGRFASVLITGGTWRREEDAAVTIFDGAERVRVGIDSGDIPYSVHFEQLDEATAGGGRPTRIEISLTELCLRGRLTLRIEPC